MILLQTSAIVFLEQPTWKRKYSSYFQSEQTALFCHLVPSLNYGSWSKRGTRRSTTVQSKAQIWTENITTADYTKVWFAIQSKFLQRILFQKKWHSEVNASISKWPCSKISRTKTFPHKRFIFKGKKKRVFHYLGT